MTSWSCRTAARRPRSRPSESETQSAVRRALDRLSEEHRQVLLLRYMQELDYGEIARALDVSEGTVKSRINRAKGRLREAGSPAGTFPPPARLTIRE